MATLRPGNPPRHSSRAGAAPEPRFHAPHSSWSPTATVPVPRAQTRLWQPYEKDRPHPKLRNIPTCPRRQISQRGEGLVGCCFGESAVVIFGSRVGDGPVLAGYVRNRSAARRRRSGDKRLQNQMRNFALLCRRQRSKFLQNGPGFRAHRLNYTIPVRGRLTSCTRGTAPFAHGQFTKMS